MNITQEQYQADTTPKIIKVKHPDYGYVEFHGMSVRQHEILKEYEKLLKKSVK